jgi:hypothetical protein
MPGWSLVNVRSTTIAICGFTQLVHTARRRRGAIFLRVAAATTRAVPGRCA